MLPLPAAQRAPPPLQLVRTIGILLCAAAVLLQTAAGAVLGAAKVSG